MKDRRKRLLSLSLAAVMCSGTIYAQMEPLYADAKAAVSEKEKTQERASKGEEAGETAAKGSKNESIGESVSKESKNEPAGESVAKKSKNEPAGENASKENESGSAEAGETASKGNENESAEGSASKENESGFAEAGETSQKETEIDSAGETASKGNESGNADASGISQKEDNSVGETVSKETETGSAGETASKENESEKETEQSSEETKPDEAETECSEKAKVVVADENGTILEKEEMTVPQQLTVGTETYPVDYLQGVYKVTVPEETKKLQITVSDQTAQEKILLTKWGGYLTEAEQIWYLYMDEPMEQAYTVEENCYLVDLEEYALSMQEITLEQLAVYGELSEETAYAEILLTGEGRSELLLIEYAQSEEAQMAETLPEESQTGETLTEENQSEDVQTGETLPEESQTGETLTEENQSEDVQTGETLSEENQSEEFQTEAVTEAETLEEKEAEYAVYAASAAKVNQAYASAGKNLADSAAKYTPTVASINGEWQIMGLARSDQKVKDSVYEDYLSNVTHTVKEKKGVLHKKKYTDYSRVIIALTALGADVTNVAGYNLLEPLADFDQTVWQGVNGAIWALIAVDSHGYEFPKAAEGKTQNSREKLIDHILAQEVSGGGWDMSGRSADPDVTAMAIQALAPYYETNAKVKSAIDRGIAKLSAIQKKNGSFATYGSETSESCSQVIVALTAMGIDPNKDSRFVKNGKSVIDALLTYANADGSFRHVLDGQADQMATEQAYYALTAYERFVGGKNRLYDMTDVVLPSDRDKAAEVEKLIAALPETVTLEDKAQINEAKKQYDSLNKTQKTLVTNADRLERAVSALEELEKEQGIDNSQTESEQTESGQTEPEQTEPKQTEPAQTNPPETEGDKKETEKQTEPPKKPGGTTQKVDLVSGGNKNPGGTTTGGTFVGGTVTGGTPTGSTVKMTEKETEEQTEETEKKAGGTKKDSTKKESEKTDQEVEGVLEDLNRLFPTSKTADQLPEAAADYSDSQKQEILNIYRAYTLLSASQKKEVEESKHYAAYQEILEKCREANHYEEITGTDLRDNEEKDLPWYVQVEAGALLADAECEKRVSDALKGQGELLTYMQISLIDQLNDASWEPENLLRVSIPMTSLNAYEHVAVVHIKEDGSMEFIEGHIAGKNLEFDTDHFSRFGIVGYNGSMEDLMTMQEEEQNWIYLLPGAAAAVLLMILGVIRASAFSKKKKGDKDSER